MTFRKLFAVSASIACLLLSAFDAPAQILAMEDFDDGVADGFMNYDSCWQVVDGEYFCEASGFQYYSKASIGDQNWGDYALDCDVKVAGAINHMVFVRMQDPGSFYEINVRGEPYNDVWILKWIDGYQYARAAAAVSNLAETWHHLRVSVNGNRIIVEFDGAQVLIYQDNQSPYLSGGISLVGFTGGVSQWVKAYFDNVIVVKEDAVATTESTWDGVKALYR